MMSNAQIPAWAITPEKVDLAVKRLVEAGRPHKIILFGSYVRGETHRDSDLDVLVVTDDTIQSTRKEGARLRGALRGIRMCMDILVVREGDFDRLKDQVGLIYREALRHGRVVYEAGQPA
jgi:predicted nucleotidyltransferase